MTTEENQAILTVTLLAAFADGAKHERERAEIKRIAEGLSQAQDIHLPTLYQDVLMKRVTLADAAPRLASEESKMLAYEMAVCICDADGVQSTAERAFLAELGRTLGLDGAAAGEFLRQADAVAAAPLSAPFPASPPDLPPASAPGTAAARGGVVPNLPEAELDKLILNAAIVNGALELLPESLSTMAIIPLQMRLVYKVGNAYGYQLDSGHIKDFLATAGVGLTSQYLEQAGRKLLRGLLGKMGGGLLKTVGGQAVSSGMSFASTYALGHLAKRYYAGGRTFSTQMIKDTYLSLTREAQGLQTQYWPQIQQRARTLDAGKVLAMVRGG
jgi:uncharacterized protein (DUF697 family)/tellurite resistance protein